MDIQATVLELATSAREAARVLARTPGRDKDEALRRLADLLLTEQAAILEANAADVAEAEAAGLDKARVDRLRLGAGTMEAMSKACLEVAEQPDPVGALESMTKRPNGMLVGRMRVPLGVIAMIYESRPNVTVESGILCLKAGNGLILRGGSEAFRSNRALAGCFARALAETGLPRAGVQLVPTTDRAAVSALLRLEDLVDLVIPRGGEGLIRTVVQEATMPVLKHYKGVCHIYVDDTADLEEAVEVVFNAKVQKPGVCNALECLLVHREAAEGLLPLVAERLGRAGVRFKADPASLELLGEAAEPADAEDFGREFLDLVLAVRQVQDQTEAQEHIARYGSNHTEAILTRDHQRAMRFVNEVDASLVVVNASTRFNDGGQLGLGAEIGISASKLHAYGPMGVTELTTTKFVLLGQGQVRQ